MSWGTDRHGPVFQCWDSDRCCPIDNYLIDPMRSDHQAEAIAFGNHDDPFSYLGPHELADGRSVIRVFVPGARDIELIDGSHQVVSVQSVDIGDGLFELTVQTGVRRPYRLRVFYESGPQEFV